MLDAVLNYVEVFTLVLVRLSSFFYLTPVFGNRSIPALLKAGFAFFLAVLLTPMIAAGDAGAAFVGLPFSELFLVLLKEVMVGITLGLIAYFIFSAVQVAGMFIDMQMGFAMANVVDPSTGTASPLTGQFKYVLATLLFLGFDGHHGLLTALLQSYQFFQVGSFQLSEGLLVVMIETFGLMFLLGIKIAMPAVAAIFLTDIGLAILSRAVPQMNVFVIGIPVKILVGMVMISIAMPAFVYLLRGVFHQLFRQMDAVLRVLGG